MKFKPQREMEKEGSYFEPASKKHKLVSGLVSLEEDDKIIGIRLQNNAEFKPSHRLRNSSQTSADEFGGLDDFELFTGSLLRELEATREALFAQMKDELKKLAADDTTEQWLQRRNVQACNQESFKESSRAHCQKSVEHDVLVQNSKESFEESSIKNCFQALEDLYHYTKVDKKLVSTEESRGEELDFHVKPNTQSCPFNRKTFSSDRTSTFRIGFIDGKRRPNPIANGTFNYNIGCDEEFVESIENLGLNFESNIASRPSNQPGSSMHLVQPFVESQRLDISSGNYAKQNALGMNFDVANHSRFARQSSENLVSCAARNNSTSLSGTGFSTSLDQDIVTTETVLGNLRDCVIFANQTSRKNDMSGSSTDDRAIDFYGTRNFSLSSHLD